MYFTYLGVTTIPTFTLLYFTLLSCFSGDRALLFLLSHYGMMKSIGDQTLTLLDIQAFASHGWIHPHIVLRRKQKLLYKEVE